MLSFRGSGCRVEGFRGFLFLFQGFRVVVLRRHDLRFSGLGFRAAG